MNTTNTLRAYHGDGQLKITMVAEARLHRESDRLAHGYGYGKGSGATFKGCAVGCTIESVNRRFNKSYQIDSHADYEPALGIPRKLARLEDGIFESLPNDLSLTWPEKFLEAIPVGADLDGVADKFMHWLLVDAQDGVIKFAKNEKTRKAIQDVADLYSQKIAGISVAREQWKAAADAAADADAAAAAAADAAADADAYAAAAAAAYAAAAARKNARARQAEKLLELMAAAPVI